MKKRLIRFVDKNKIYLGIILFFVIWMLFFDDYNWIRIRRDRLKYKALKKEAIYLQEKIDTDKASLKALRTDSTLEKFAREKYLMKKPNEDVYVIIEK
ncbi:MAG TPA: septum formation initiator family protein [Prolixibacteraceae bacterium]|nr:septum formation initiator family protein [Prolixibacteraceae bacterium]HPS12326.1 septum formation initiator family protein [Prolixibacteraceae bacterium]